jgi:hypothetical protein
LLESRIFQEKCTIKTYKFQKTLALLFNMSYNENALLRDLCCLGNLIPFAIKALGI